MLVGIKRVVTGEVAHAVVGKAKSSVSLVVGVQNHLIAALRGQDAIIGKRFGGVEVEYEHQVVAREGQNLVVILLPRFFNRELLEFVLRTHKLYHVVVKCSEILVFQVGAVN